MEILNNGVLYMGYFSILNGIFNVILKIMATYAIYLAIKSFKIYIKNNL